MKKQHTLHIRQIFAIFLATGLVMPIQAGSLESHASIKKVVTQFIIKQNVPLNNIQVTLTSLNNKLKLPQCRQPLQVSMAPGTKLLGHTSLAVKCTYPQKWKIHVAAHVDGLVNALTARHPISRGTVIQETDLEFVPKRYSQLNYGYYGTATQLTNMEARRNIKSGQVLTPGILKAQKLVLRGQHVTIVAQNAGLNLRVKGKAMMDGQQGQTIKVKNLSSKKLIYAQVVSMGIVKVNF